MVLPIPVGASIAKERPCTTRAAQARCSGQGGAPTWAAKKRAQSARASSWAKNRASAPARGLRGVGLAAGAGEPRREALAFHLAAAVRAVGSVARRDHGLILTPRLSAEPLGGLGRLHPPPGRGFGRPFVPLSPSSEAEA